MFDEFILSTKGRGSIVIFSTRDQYLTDYGYQKKMDALEADGTWKLMKNILIDKYDKLGDQNLGRYKKTQVRVLAYQI